MSVALLLQRQHPLQPNVENFPFSQISQSHQVLHHHCDNRTNFVQLDIANSQSHQVLHHHCDFSIRIENLTFDHLTISPGPPPSLRRQIGIKCRFRNSLTISPGPPPSLRPSLPYGKYYLSHDGTIGDFQGAHNLTRSSTIIATV